MSIGYKKQSAASVPTPPAGEQNTFIDSADDKLKKKLDTGVVVDLEGLTAGVTSFEGRSGIVVGAAGDYNASEVTFTPSGGLSASTVEAAIYELDNEKVPVSHIGSGGGQHADVTILASGFMSVADKVKLDGVDAGATQNSADAFLLARANHTGTQTASTISDFNTSADARITLQKGAANGLAPLNASSKIDATYLPAYVDDVLEFANLAAFPVTGEASVLYVALDTNKVYRWSGSAYIEISASPGSTDAVPEGATNKYFLESRAIASILAGLSEAYGQITSSDSILQALSKVAFNGNLHPQNINADLVIPADYNLIRGETKLTGTSAIVIGLNGMLKIL